MYFLSNDACKSHSRSKKVIDVRHSVWSNFEIADMDFWRGEFHTGLFDFLENACGFYYERWGDAPVHSIAAALFARKDQLHFLKNIARTSTTPA
ncbi:glycolipid 2-alpha-mannosyltransferase-domain-containing protein [Suillus lakei]|nr:glycolipid 2-alpha-mannosyltransferase-domain-containing protein [Suillus lakei]